MFEEVVVVRDFTMKHRLRQAASTKIGTQFRFVGDAAILLLPAVALPGQVREVLLRRFVADGDVNLALGQGEVGDLVVAAARESLAFQVLPRVQEGASDTCQDCKDRI